MYKVDKVEKYRSDFVEEIMEYKSWSNRRRVELESSKHDAQEILDFFRDQLFIKIAKMTDNDIPKTHDDRWKFIHDNWDEYLISYLCRYISRDNVSIQINLSRATNDS